MSQMNDRIESTCDLVNDLIKINEQVRKEVITILPGPAKDSLTLYLDSINNLDSIYRNMSTKHHLSYCKISLERISLALTDGKSKLLAAFHDWLQEESSTLAHLDDVTTDNTSPISNSNISINTPQTLVALNIISSHCLASPSQFSSIINTWIDLRSNYLASSCEPLFLSSQSYNPTTNTTKPSHPLPKAFRLAHQLLETEQVIMSQVLPSTAVGPTFLRSAQILRDLAVSTVEIIISKMKKSLNRREYLDQIYLLEVMSGAYSAVFNASKGPSEDPSDTLSFAVQILQPSVKLLVTSVASIITDLFGEIRATIPRAIERPFIVTSNATVYELTSLLINVLKRLTELYPILESLLRSQATENWNGSLIQIANTNNDDDRSVNNEDNAGSIKEEVDPILRYPTVYRFYSDILGALETCLDTKSKTLRRPIQTLLFQLNNYNYIYKNITTLLVSDAAIKRYDQIIEALQRSFVNRCAFYLFNIIKLLMFTLFSWTMIANLITSENTNQLIMPQSARSTHSTSSTAGASHVKDRLKAFTLEFDDAVKIQSALSVPDLELRASLVDKVKQLILQPYIYFYNQYNSYIFSLNRINMFFLEINLYLLLLQI